MSLFQNAIDTWSASGLLMLSTLLSLIGGVFFPFFLPRIVGSKRSDWVNVAFAIFFALNYAGLLFFRKDFPLYKFGVIYLVALIVLLVLMLVAAIARRERGVQ